MERLAQDEDGDLLLYLHSGLVGWHSGHPTLAVGAVGEAVGLGPTAAGTPGEVIVVVWPRIASCGAPSLQPPASRVSRLQPAQPPLALAGRASAQAGFCPRPGALSALSPRRLADHCGHHLPTPYAPHPDASQARRRPSADRPGACGARPFRLDLCRKRPLRQGVWGSGQAQVRPGRPMPRLPSRPSATTGLAGERSEPHRSEFEGNVGVAPS